MSINGPLQVSFETMSPCLQRLAEKFRAMIQGQKGFILLVNGILNVSLGCLGIKVVGDQGNASQGHEQNPDQKGTDLLVQPKKPVAPVLEPRREKQTDQADVDQ